MDMRSISAAAAAALAGALAFSCAAPSGGDSAAPAEEPDDDPMSARGAASPAAVPSGPAGALAVLGDFLEYTPYRGGPGGASYSVQCAPGQIATGIHGRSDDYVREVGLICRRLAGDGSLGAEEYSETAGGDDGVKFRSECPAGQGMVGLGGGYGAYLERIQIICDTLPGGALSYGQELGGPGGNPFDDLAPERYFLIRLLGRSSDYVDGIQGVFQHVEP